MISPPAFGPRPGGVAGLPDDFAANMETHRMTARAPRPPGTNGRHLPARLSDGERDTLRSLWVAHPKATGREICAMFEAATGRTLDVGNAQRHRQAIPELVGNRGNGRNRLAPAEAAWLRQLIANEPGMTVSMIRQEFTARFGRHISKDHIGYYRREARLKGTTDNRRAEQRDAEWFGTTIDHMRRICRDIRRAVRRPEGLPKGAGAGAALYVSAQVAAFGAESPHHPEHRPSRKHRPGREGGHTWTIKQDRAMRRGKYYEGPARSQAG